jgi:hypothetical protein
MGHATQAFATVVALTGLLGIKVTAPAYVQLMLQARRISVNRIVSGVHFPIDAAAGQMLGMSLGEFFLSVCGVNPTWQQRTFAPGGNGGGDPANNFLGDGPPIPTGGQIGQMQGAVPSAFLQRMTALAKAEWDV